MNGKKESESRKLIFISHGYKKYQSTPSEISQGIFSEIHSDHGSQLQILSLGSIQKNFPWKWGEI